ncbi:Major Facilitator Superfamily protein [Aspergillus niger]|nr:hypothetical protein M747DRAFT_291719 [Aspergillus niger ATCC 13496]TPR07128.1 Major Facilitator Superfamily protein [Aspergillus niger]
MPFAEEAGVRGGNYDARRTTADRQLSLATLTGHFTLCDLSRTPGLIFLAILMRHPGMTGHLVNISPIVYRLRELQVQLPGCVVFLTLCTVCMLRQQPSLEQTSRAYDSLQPTAYNIPCNVLLYSAQVHGGVPDL